MQLKIICLFFVLAFAVANASQCNTKKVNYCKGWLLLIYLVNPSYDGYMYSVCLGLSRVTNCLDEVVKECGEGDINQEIDEVRQKLSRIEQICRTKEPEVPVNMEKCSRSLQKELNRCVTDLIDEVLGRRISEQSLDRIRCSIYQFISNCVIHKDEHSCGKIVGQVALDQMFDLPEEIQENCGNSVVNGSLKGLVYETVTESRNLEVSSKTV